MKRVLFFFSISILFTLQTKAQTAVDFTLTDCSSYSRNLFSLLDQGKIVILVYEHQCSSCTQGAHNVSSVVNSFYSADTSMLVIYLDNGGYNCASILSWITNNSLVAGPYIAYSSSLTSPYGSGMPVIVVAAGNAHKTYLTSLGPSDTNTIHNAIKTAIADQPSGMIRTSSIKTNFSIFPNPVTAGILTLDFHNSLRYPVKADIIDLTGNVMKSSVSISLSEKDSKCEIIVSDLREGIYFIRVITPDGTIAKKFTIVN